MVLQCSFNSSPSEEHDTFSPCDDLRSQAGLEQAEGYLVYPWPVESPFHGERRIEVSPADVKASPFGWHDVDGLVGAEYLDTRGNNVFAQDDIDGLDLNEDRPDGGGSLAFAYDLDFSEAPSHSVEAAVTNLFYWNNINHDVFYHYGFDEAAGNFQINNYDRFGAGNDQIYADAQDGSDRNNARFFVAEDGVPGRMQMYLWNMRVYDASVRVLKADGSVTTINAVESGFSANNKLRFGEIDQSEIVLIKDANRTTSLACLSTAIIDIEEIRGKIALVDRGTCFFVEKVRRMQDLGAKAVIVCNNEAGDAIVMGGEDQSVTIPAVMIGEDQCAILKSLLAEGKIEVEIRRQSDPGVLDSALDNLIISHEYGHGISVRLLAGANSIDGLDNNEQMGEGWSDYFGLMLTTNWSSANPEDIRGIGTYVSNQSITGKGIRQYPYSTNQSVNPMIYDDLKNSPITHHVGAVWCSMLWDMTWNIIESDGRDQNIYTGSGGNNIALRLVMEGLKILNCYPGFVDGRNAILMADSLLYQGQHQFQIWKSFAGRGLGFSADQGSSHNTFDGKSSFDLPPIFRTSIREFTATEQTDHIHIHFISEREYDNRLFVLQRSTDKITYARILNFEGKLIEPNQRVFQYADLDVSQGQIYYYRLLSQDIRQRETIMASDSALLIPVDEVLVFPNPARDQTFIKLSRSYEGKVQINLFSTTGQKLYSVSKDAEELYTRYLLDLTTLTPGVYILELATQRGQLLKKLVLR
ncbi:MAG: M36 family metallopeptidase [Saprospiraceae bacterium]|nr:M36 family metallopeptidase [Saprospiraceae bacterium]